jgi:hypothetical protein
MSKTITIQKRAKDASDGVRVQYQGRMVDPRYRPAPKTFCEDLGITTLEMLKADTRMLIDSTRRKSNAIGRVITARRLAGVTGRDVQQATRLAVGKAAVDMREIGLTNAEIRDVFGLPTQRYLDTCLRDARTIAAIGAVTPKPKAKRTPKSVPAPEPVVESVIVDAEPEEASRAHEVLRGTRETAVIGDGVVVARINRSYDLNVTTVGTYLPRARTPAESPPARRASSRLVEA